MTAVDDGPSAAEVAQVDRAVRRFARELASARLRLYRQHLQVTVTAATPLLALIVRDRTVDVPAALRRLRPSVKWPEASRRSRMLSRYSKLLHAYRFSEVAAGLGYHDASREALVRSGCRRDGQLLIRVGDGALEVTARVGDVRLATDGGRVMVTLPFHLPDALEDAMPGRPISCLVSHPWFAYGGWLVDGVERADGRTTFSVATGLVPFTMPWRSLLGSPAAVPRAWTRP